MTRIRVRQEVAAPVSAVWAELADIPHHVEWMMDAESLTFVDGQTRGVGTRFDCVTKIGPFRTMDHMEITSWREGRSIGVRHTGFVTGNGTMSVRKARRGRSGSVVRWSERLRFRWYVGGPFTAALARPIIRRIWRGNLRRLAARVEAGH